MNEATGGVAAVADAPVRERSAAGVRAFGSRVLLALLVTYAVVLGGTWSGIYVTELRITSLVLAAAGLATWAVLMLRDPAWRPTTHLGLGFLALGVAWVLSTITSRSPRISLEYLAWAVILCALYLFLVRILADAARRRLVGIVSLFLTAMIGVVYVALTVEEWIRWWQLLGRFAPPPLRPSFIGSVYGNPSAVMTVSILLWLAGIALVGPRGRRQWAAVAALGVLVALVTLLSGSRAGWLAVAVTLAATIGFAAVRMRRRVRPLARAHPRALASAVVLAALVGVFVVPGVLARAGAGGEEQRATYIASAVRMFVASPLIGMGPGMWVVDRSQFTRSSEPDDYIPHAHDIYAQAIAEFGITGVVAGATLALALGWLVSRSLRDPRLRRTAVVVVVGTIYLALHDILDSYANMPAVLLGWGLPLAALDGIPDPHVKERASSAHLSPSHPAVLAALGVVVLGSSVGLAWSERWALLNDQAVTAAASSKWDTAGAIAREIVSRDSAIPAYLLTAGIAASEAGDHERARGLFEAAASEDDLPQSWLDLAAEQIAMGDGVAAKAALTRALRLGWQQPIVALGSAQLCARLGDRSCVDRALAASAAFAPSLVKDDGWGLLAAAGSGRRRIVEQAMAQNPGQVAWEIAVEFGDLPLTRLAASGVSRDARPVVDLATTAVSGDDRAREALVELAEHHPGDRFALHWAARVSRLANDQRAATRLMSLAEISLGDPTVGYSVVVLPHETPSPAAGDRTLWYGLFTYRRATASPLLAAGLPTLGYR